MLFKRIIAACYLVPCLLVGWCYLRGDRINPMTYSCIKKGLTSRQVELILGGPPRQTPNPLPISTHTLRYPREGCKLPGGAVVRNWFSSAALIYVFFDEQDRVFDKAIWD